MALASLMQAGSPELCTMTGASGSPAPPNLGVQLTVVRVSHSYGALKMLHDEESEVGPGKIFDRLPWRHAADDMAYARRAHLGKAATASNDETISRLRQPKREYAGASL